MTRSFLFFIAFVSNTVIATEDAQVVVDDILFLYDAEKQWNEYVRNSVRSTRESLTYPELYQEELDSWLTDQLSWSNVEPIFREELSTRYSIEQLQEMAESLRDHPSGYPDDPNARAYGPELFNLGVYVARQVYPPLTSRLNQLKAQFETVPHTANPEVGRSAQEAPRAIE